MPSLRLVHLYPSRMNLYGDRGNVVTLVRRAEWRGWHVLVDEVEVGMPADFARADLAFMGGGEDRQQAAIADDLRARAAELTAALADGLPFLAVCGAFQLLGESYTGQDGRTLPGIGWFDAVTRPGGRRAIGNIAVEADSSLGLPVRTLVGFENHGGRTTLGPGQRPLGRVVVGSGNNGQDRTEGAVKGHAIGTYLHGALLPKNPHLADLLLGWALERRGLPPELPPLDDTAEWAAHRSVLSRIRRTPVFLRGG
jgi:CobQ-like glutamine amidotransferase family enzyme